ncbi:MAG: DUF4386 domain-containing protein [Mobilitalea sp.]
MDTHKKSARIAGVLLIIGTVTGMLSASLMSPILDGPEYLGKIAGNENKILIGALLIFIMAVACAGIAFSLYPILKKYNDGLAIAAVGFRVIEAVLMTVSVIIYIVLVALSHEFVKAGAPAETYFQTLGVLLNAGVDWVSNVGMLLAWCLGAMIYYYIFYKTKLIPRWLSGWGLISTALCIMASLLVMLHQIGPFSTMQIIMNLPIAVQEMVLAVWLILKGFKPSAVKLLLARK